MQIADTWMILWYDKNIGLNKTSVYRTSGASNFQQLKKTILWMFSDSTQLQGL